jgi:hypothetical protein
MKLTQLLGSMLALACGLTTAFTPASAQAAGSGGITVKAVAPRAWFTGPDGKTVKLQAGMTLPEGARIKTSGSGSVNVFVGSVSTAFQVTGGSDVTIQKAAAATAATPTTPAASAELKITVKAGGLVANSTAMSVDTKFSVVTPKGAELTVKPSEFALTAEGSVVVKSGSVEVKTTTVQNGQAAAQTTTVAANQEFKPATTTGGNAGAPTVQATPPAVQKAMETTFAAVATVVSTSTAASTQQTTTQQTTTQQTTTQQTTTQQTTTQQTTAGTGTGAGVTLTSTLQDLGNKNSNP